MENKVIVGSLNPCFTHYLPEVERYEDLAKEVRLFTIINPLKYVLRVMPISKSEDT